MSGGVPAGWVLVPVEPTREMVEAIPTGAYSRAVWANILSATPTPPSRDADVEGDVSLAEAARDLLDAQKRLGPAVAFRLDLWACLEANLEGKS